MTRKSAIIISALLFALVSLNGAVCEQSQDKPVAMGSCGEKIIWVLYETAPDSHTFELQIIGSGAMNNWSSNSSPWNAYKNDITEVIVDKGITTVGDNAFYECLNLKSVVLPENLDSIGKRAFANCPKLSSLKFADRDLIPPTIVIEQKTGDINDDGTVNGKDSMLLLQYLAGWDIELSPDSADINGDGAINGKDSMLLLQYLAGWESAYIK